MKPPPETFRNDLRTAWLAGESGIGAFLGHAVMRAIGDVRVVHAAARARMPAKVAIVVADDEVFVVGTGTKAPLRWSLSEVSVVHDEAAQPGQGESLFLAMASGERVRLTDLPVAAHQRLLSVLDTPVGVAPTEPLPVPSRHPHYAAPSPPPPLAPSGDALRPVADERGAGSSAHPARADASDGAPGGQHPDSARRVSRFKKR